MEPTYCTSVTLTPPDLPPEGMEIRGDVPHDDGTHPVLLGLIRPDSTQLPLTTAERTALFTAAHAAYPD